MSGELSSSDTQVQSTLNCALLDHPVWITISSTLLSDFYNAPRFAYILQTTILNHKKWDALRPKCVDYCVGLLYVNPTRIFLRAKADHAYSIIKTKKSLSKEWHFKKKIKGCIPPLLQKIKFKASGKSTIKRTM